MPSDLTFALEATLGRHPVEPLRRATTRLIEVYRSGAPPTSLALSDPVAAAAYAAYRMPATHAAVTRALGQVVAPLSDLEVGSLVDVGGGTGAAAWAVTEALPDLSSVTVVDGSREALDLGRRIAAHGPESMATSAWIHSLIAPGIVLPQTDLVTVSYVLGELPGGLYPSLVDAITSSSRLALLIEPGTPRGYAAVLAVRSRLIAAGWHVLAPCPHSGQCPLVGSDWCHFPARLDRSALHRRLKNATLGHEDEKFSFVLASRDPGPVARARVLRHPMTRKGLVQLDLCRQDGTAGTQIVSKRAGSTYRHARGVGWGDEWSIAPEALR